MPRDGCAGSRRAGYLPELPSTEAASCVLDDKREERSSCGMLRYAEDYRGAARKVIGAGDALDAGLVVRACHLGAQLMELGLEASLLSAGRDSSKLQRIRSGRGINALFAQFEEPGTGALVSLDDTDRQLGER